MQTNYLNKVFDIKKTINKRSLFLVGLSLLSTSLFSVQAIANNEDKYFKEDSKIQKKYEGKIDAIKTLERRMELGDMNARYELFVIYKNGYGVSKDVERAKHVLNYCTSQECNDRKADEGLRSGFEKSYDTTRDGLPGVDAEVVIVDPWKSDFSTVDLDRNGIPDEVEKEARIGNRHAQYQLGKIYLEGKGHEIDYKNARKWLGLAALKLVPEAVILMGEMYEYGIGTKVDNKKSVRWYRLAKQYDEQSVRDIIIRLTKKIEEENLSNKIVLSPSKAPSELKHRIKDDVISRMYSYIPSGETKSFGDSADLKVSEYKDFYKDRVIDMGWTVTRTEIDNVYNISRKLRFNGSSEKDIEMKWKANGFNGPVTNIK